ncbi:acyltransferase [Glaciecola sp. MH2013]|uniref:acyltransferase n=1 Tax=Glaciecola sp. MH2013 TaxID=2785524 RepID=UPI0018A0FA42|nr:acyltransferase [Glaciecola sp. MH2013]MBF7072233.1 acyltransferase [Glaciecola sp. MH2013]
MLNSLKGNLKELAKSKLGLAMLRGYYFIIGSMGYFYRYKYFFKCTISRTARVTGWKQVSLGRNVVICNRTWLNVNHRDSQGIKAITIGDNSFIGENNFLTAGAHITIGAYALTTSNCSFIGASHNIDSVMTPYIRTGVDSENIIQVGVNCFFGYGSTVIGNVSIGHGSIIGAKSVVLHDIPPFSIVVGNPAKVIKRYDFSSQKWVKTDIDESLIPSQEEYLELVEKGNDLILMPYILAAKNFSSII